MSFHKLFKISWRPAFNDSAVDKKDSQSPHLDSTVSISAANKEEIRTPAGLIGTQQRSGADEEPSEMFGPI